MMKSYSNIFLRGEIPVSVLNEIRPNTHQSKMSKRLLRGIEKNFNIPKHPETSDQSKLNE